MSALNPPRIVAGTLEQVFAAQRERGVVYASAQVASDVDAEAARVLLRCEVTTRAGLPSGSVVAEVRRG